jgi:hypothetical protein
MLPLGRLRELAGVDNNTRQNSASSPAIIVTKRETQSVSSGDAISSGLTLIPKPLFTLWVHVVDANDVVLGEIKADLKPNGTTAYDLCQYVRERCSMSVNCDAFRVSGAKKPKEFCAFVFFTDLFFCFFSSAAASI